MRFGSDKGLKTTTSRHENGRVIPGEEWRKLYRLVYGRTDEELGGLSHPAAAPIARCCRLEILNADPQQPGE
jgi:hypothetical protein